MTVKKINYLHAPPIGSLPERNAQFFKATARCVNVWHSDTNVTESLRSIVSVVVLLTFITLSSPVVRKLNCRKLVEGPPRTLRLVLGNGRTRLEVPDKVEGKFVLLKVHLLEETHAEDAGVEVQALDGVLDSELYGVAWQGMVARRNERKKAMNL